MPYLIKIQACSSDDVGKGGRGRNKEDEKNAPADAAMPSSVASARSPPPLPPAVLAAHKLLREAHAIADAVNSASAWDGARTVAPRKEFFDEWQASTGWEEELASVQYVHPGWVPKLAKNDPHRAILVSGLEDPSEVCTASR